MLPCLPWILDRRPFPGSARRRYFDFDRLREVTHAAARNLNRIIDINFYPVETARRSNFRHRPIGIGVQVPLHQSALVQHPGANANIHPVHAIVPSILLQEWDIYTRMGRLLAPLLHHFSSTVMMVF